MEFQDRIKGLRRVPASKLVPHPENWRRHADGQRKALATALDAIGWADAIVARVLDDGSYQILDGHLRAETADGKVPVLVVDLNDDEARLLLATHDPIGAMAETDDAQLRGLLSSLESDDQALSEMLGQIGQRFDLIEPDEPIDVSDVSPRMSQADELQREFGTEPDQIWAIRGKRNHRLAIGSSVDPEVLARLFGDSVADVVVTSPPYNQAVGTFSKSGMHSETRWVENVNSGSYEDDLPEEEYQRLQVKSIDMWSRFVSSTGSVFYNHKNRFRDKQCVSPWTWLAASSAKVRQEIIWLREGSVTQNMRGFMPVDERIFWLYYGDDFYFNDSTRNKTFSTVWKISAHKDLENSLHGCAFPLELPTRCIVSCSRKGNVVFDPYMGSGTTLLAAKQLGRVGYGCELSPVYAAVSLARMRDAGCSVELASQS